MPRFLRARWVLLAAVFLAVNVAGLVAILARLDRGAPELGVDSFAPQGTVDPDSSFTVGFNQPMASPADVGKPADVSVVRFTPDVPADARWENATTLAIYPRERLRPATPYTAVVKQGVAGLWHRPLPRDLVFHFQTPALAVLDVTHRQAAYGQPITVTIRFNAPVVPDEVERRLSVAGGTGRPLRFTLGGRAPGREVTIETEATDEKTLQVTVARGLCTPGGPLGLPADDRRLLAVNADLVLGAAEAFADGPVHGSIVIACSQPVSAAAARAHLRVEPPAPFTVEWTGSALRLAGAFSPASRVRVTVAKGLPGLGGARLQRDVVRTAVFADLAPAVRFRGQGIYLAGEGALRVPLETVNVREVEVALERVYENNVVHYLRSYNDWSPPRDLGRVVATRTIALDAAVNRPLVTPVSLEDLAGPKPRGVFHLTVTDAKNRWRRDRRLLLVTDLGLTVKRSPADVLVRVNSLSTARPVPGAAVAVYTRASQKAFEGVTDADGIVRFAVVDGSAERAPFAVIASRDGDAAALDLGETALDDSTFDAGGRPWVRAGYEAFVYADRGLYRPGETIHLAALVRAPGPSLPAPFPVEFRVLRPDGHPFQTAAALVTAAGSAGADVALPPQARTGRYAVELRLPKGDAPIGVHDLQVEDFLPDRMKVEVTAADRRFRADEPIPFAVRAAHLFGAPAAGRAVTARCEYAAAPFAHPAWPGYSFSDASRDFPVRREEEAKASLDAAGRVVYAVKVPPGLAPPSALRALFTVSVHEPGGRAVTASLARDVDPYPAYAGVAREREGNAAAGQPERFRCALVKPDGAGAASGALEVVVAAVRWNSVLKTDERGRYRWETRREEEPVQKTTCAVADGRGSVAFSPAGPGSYVIRVKDPEGGASADLEFYAGGGGDEAAVPMERPDRLTLAPDRTAYAPGDTARVVLTTPFPGEALLTIESDRIHVARALALTGNTHTFEIPIEAAYGPNIYCAVSVVRGIDPAARWAPHRAYGVATLRIDQEPHRLKVELDAPEEVRPGAPLRVRVRARTAAGAPARAEVTLSAVDEGVCLLTRYATPDPWAFFCAKRAKQVTTCDLYSLLMPEFGKTPAGTPSEEGGDAGEIDPRLINPVVARRVRTAAVWKAGLATGEDGAAEVTFDAPVFTGQLRLMAVAAAAADFGSAGKPVFVRQPLMVNASLPRFLAPRDEFAVPATVYNRTGAPGAVEVRIEGDGGTVFASETAQRVEVPAGGEKTVVFLARAPERPGAATIRVRAALGAETASDEAEIPVRPPASLRQVAGTGSVRAGATARVELPAGWMPGTDASRIAFSALPALTLGPALDYLLHYPYGCVEQTTSSAFPLLYLRDISDVADPGRFGKGEVEPYVQAAIDRLFTMQTYGGGFAMWPRQADAYPWGSVYAAHFLAEAAKAGYPVPRDGLDAALDYLNRGLAAKEEEGFDPPVKAYACLVLAAAGRPNASWTWRLYEERDRLPSWARFQVASALALLNEGDSARALLASEALPVVVPVLDTGGALHSSTREAAILLSAYLDLAPDHPNVPVLVERLQAAMKNGCWLTTQENGFALLALGKYARRLAKTPADFQAEVRRDGQPPLAFTHLEKKEIREEKTGGRPLEVQVTGRGTLYYFWTSEGVPASGAVPDRDGGLKVRRRYLARDGRELKPGAIPHGQTVIVEITLEADRSADNVVVSDLLPAGLEIENPRLATADAGAAEGAAPAPARSSWEGASAPDRPASAPPAAKVPPPMHPTHVEMRDDRLLLFVNVADDGPRVFRYAARAVTRGRFALPPVQATCMYDPSLSSAHGAGVMVIEDAK